MGGANNEKKTIQLGLRDAVRLCSPGSGLSLHGSAPRDLSTK
jgi:hypothetical protein